MDNFFLKGKHALVGGGSKGIGRAIAIALSEAGAQVTLMARSEDSLLETIHSLHTDAGQKHDFIIADYHRPDELRELVQHQLRDIRYQILINNTGGPAPGTLLDSSLEAFESAFRAHLICNHMLAMLLLPGMKQSGYGRIINIISTSAKQPIPGLAVSNTVRAAVANWAKTLSMELAPLGITVNNVLPGATNTDRLREIIRLRAQTTGRRIDDVENEMLREIPMGRFGYPEEIAASVVFLASPAAAYITGINLPVDGGRISCL